MRAMILRNLSEFSSNPEPLEFMDLPEPSPAGGEVLLRVQVCGVCHTELDEIEGRTPPHKLPVIPGHQVIGTVTASGPDVRRFSGGERVGVAWIFSACGECELCRSGLENLCDRFRATGRDVDGGYAEFMTAPENYVYPIPEIFEDAEAAPLLCAGAIGYRSVSLCRLENGHRLGLTGFGASGHLVLKMVRHQYPDTPVYVFARSADERAFAKELGAVWAGESKERTPEALHAIIDTTPVWKPVVDAMKNLRPDGRLVINAIRKEDNDKSYLEKLDYERDLWMEKEIKSVANVARSDVENFLRIAEEIPIKPDYQEYPLEEANRALMELKQGNIRGARVLRIGRG